MNASNLVDTSTSFKNVYDFDLELDFDLMGIEVEEVDDNELSEEIKEWVEGKPKPNLELNILLRSTLEPWRNQKNYKLGLI